MEDFYDELDMLIDEAPSLDDLLENRDLTKKQALIEADKFTESFREHAGKAGIDITAGKSLAWYQTAKKENSEQVTDMIFFLLSDSGFFFSESADDEERISSYLITSDRYNELWTWYRQHVEKSVEFALLREKTAGLKPPRSRTESDSSLKVFNMLCKNGYVSDSADKRILKDNLASVGELIESDKDLKKVAPLVYFQAYVHNRKKMLEKPDFMLNPQNLFRVERYGTNSDNGKNFDKYAEYCSLYLDLKDCLPEADLPLCDEGFLACSNLSDWFFDNIEYDENMPVTVEFVAGAFSPLLFCEDGDELPFIDECGISIDEVCEFREAHPELERKARKAAANVTLDDLPEMLADSKQFAGRIFEAARLASIVRADNVPKMYALLVFALEMRFEDILTDRIVEMLNG